MAEIISISCFGKAKEQTLLTLHLATFLAAEHRTALVDFLPQTHVLENFIAKRHYFNLKNNQNLPVPAYFENSKNLLSKILPDFDFIVLDDASGSLLEYADIVLTPVFDELTVDLICNRDSLVSKTIWQAKMNRAKKGKNAFKHVLIPSDLLKSEQIDRLKKNASMAGYTLSPSLIQNEAYASCLKDGVTVLDKDSSFLLKNFDQNDFFVRRNLKQILEFVWFER